MKEGQVFVGRPGQLKCKCVMHAVGPKWQHGSHNERENIQDAIIHCLEESERNNVKSISIPAISTGIFWSTREDRKHRQSLRV